MRRRTGTGTSLSNSRSTSCRKTRYLSESSQGGKMYGPSKLSFTILLHTLTVKRYCVDLGRVLCGLFKIHMCAWCVLNTPSREKVASSQNNTELAKCMSATLWFANATRHL
ncbi:hypothetical protein TNCT_53081 [Trichonephila clavata]|uniref:Uncharacterized protein n=1 Tax=Trichonephila clavata TaxID=2740835 RepID=A0A8X6M303_TRICU|nr:hypothetical protein TNCT_53081 [Trichonephila clavata]